MAARTYVLRSLIVLSATLIALHWNAGEAQTSYTEDFTQKTTTNNWYFFNGACLTAGSSAPAAQPSTVPGCSNIFTSYYKQQQDKDVALVGGTSGYLGSIIPPTGTTITPDPAGSGALRFTNGFPYGHAENGAIVSGFTFPNNQGLLITFKTVTYLGDSGGGGGDGADGMSFYLMDGSQPPGLGSWGGSLGYTCSNSNPPYDGLVGAYLGLGIDEFGNFLNQGDNTNSGFGYVPGRIGLRGAGNISWAYLNATYPTLYPSSWSSSQRQSAVRNTCANGVLQDYNGNNLTYAGTNPYAVMDYPAINNANVTLSGVTIANEGATTRSGGTPILYRLKLTADGLLSLSYSYNGGAYNSVITNQSITAQNGTLPNTFRFGFAGSTGGDTNVHEIMCFRVQPATASEGSAGVNEKQAAKVQTGTQAYFAYFDPTNWTGSLTANSVIDTNGVVSISQLANWDASCVLTGVASSGTCVATGATGAASAQSPSSRVMLTWSGSAGIPFEWSNLSSTQKSILDSGDSGTKNANRLNYLRGDRSNEVTSSGSGTFRHRDSVLGDIVDASPVVVSFPQSPYTTNWRDRLYPSASRPENTGQSYAAFVTAEQGRTNVVYAGANDGFIHGFRTGSFDANGNYIGVSPTPNDGQEVLAYMPGAILTGVTVGSSPTVSVADTIHGTNPANSNKVTSALDYANVNYGHNFYLDATPGTGDLYYGAAWHTWLVGGLGIGGAAIYALDITDPSTFSETGTAPASTVIGEWNAATITCSGSSTCGTNLGNTLGTPQIRRLHNGIWGVIFGNGFGSQSGDAGIYVMTVDSTTHASTFYYLSTGWSSKTSPPANGISYVAPADLDGDHVTDYVYAGDLQGNLWRFDLTSSDPTKWAVTAGPLFTTPSGQPITTKPVIASVPVAGSSPRLMVGFGTGQRTQLTNSTPTSYSSSTQDLYGVWDWNLSAWNSVSTSQYQSLAGTQTGLSSPYTLQKSNLQQQTFTVQANGDRDGTSNTICWQAQTLCTPASANSKFGWYVDLPGANGSGFPEQIVYNPLLYQQAFIVNSVVPASNSPLSCTTTADLGYTYVISMGTGAAFGNTVFPNHDTNVAGFQSGATGTPSVLTTAEGTTYLIYQTIGDPVPGTKNATPRDTSINLPPNTKSTRLTWVELR
jgi:type IV pilus assembly protein PilY1